jgi:hypothetical protein
MRAVKCGLLFSGFLIGCSLLGCAKEAAFVHSDCYLEYASLVKPVVYADEIDAGQKNESVERPFNCGSLPEALLSVKPEEVEDLRIAVKEASASNEYSLCISEKLSRVGLLDTLTVTTPISPLDRVNAILRGRSQGLGDDVIGAPLPAGVAEKFREQEERLLAGDRDCRRRTLGWAIP